MNMKQWISLAALSFSICCTHIFAQQCCEHHEHEAAVDAHAVPAGTQSASVSSVDAGRQDAQGKQAGLDKKADKPDQLLLQVLDGNQEVIKAFMDSLVNGNLQKRAQQMEERRLRLLDTLPEALRTKVQDALKMHVQVAEQLKMDIFLRKLCEDLFIRVQKQVPDAVQGKADALAAVQLLNRALSDGSFMRIVTVMQLTGDMQDPQRMMRQLLEMLQQTHEESSFTEKDIVAIRTKLEVIRKYAQEHKDEAAGTMTLLAADLTVYIQYLDWAEKKDVRSLAKACVGKISPLIGDCLVALKTTVTALADERLQTSQDAHPELVEALEFWMKQLKGHIHTLSAFQRVVTLSGIDLSYVMQALSYAYELAEGYFEYYRFDAQMCKPTGWWLIDKAVSGVNASNALDLGMRCTMLGLTGIHRIGEVASGEVQKCILGTGSLTSFVNPFEEPTYAMMLLMHSTPILTHPSQERLTVLQRGFFRITGALLWNIYFNRNTAGFSAWPVQGKDNNANAGAADNKGAADVKGAAATDAKAATPASGGASAQQNSGNEGSKFRDFFTTTLLITIKELQWFVADEVSSLTQCKDHPRDGRPCQHCIRLEKLENYSLGILKPDFIHFAFELLTTVALFKAGNIQDFVGHLSAESYAMHYASRSGIGIDDWMLKHAYIKPAARDDGSYPEHPRYRSDDQKISFYLEYQVVRYLFESVGSFCGKNVVHKPIYAAVSGFAKAISTVLGKAGKFMFGISDEDEQAIVSEYHRYITEMRTIIRRLFCEQSPERVMMVGLLKNMRYLHEEDTDPKTVNLLIIGWVLYYLAQYHLITHVQEAQLYEEYYKHQNDVMKFLDIVFDTLDKNKASITGGKIGGWVGHIVASYVELAYGPIVFKGKPA
jgi:hypothetical protein